MQLLLYETDDSFELIVAVVTAIKQFQVFESLFLQCNQYTGQQFLISNGVALKPVGNHIINILDEYHVGIQVVQVFNQSAMTTRTEKQLAFIIAERIVFHIGSYSVGTWLLLRE